LQKLSPYARPKITRSSEKSLGVAPVVEQDNVSFIVTLPVLYLGLGSKPWSQKHGRI